MRKMYYTIPRAISIHLRTNLPLFESAKFSGEGTIDDIDFGEGSFEPIGFDEEM